MSTLIDPSSNNTTNSNSFLYQNLPPSSPIISSSQQQQPQPQPQQPSSDNNTTSPLILKEEKSKNNNSSNEHLYIVSPKPSTSRTSITTDEDTTIRRSSIHASIKFENNKSKKQQQQHQVPSTTIKSNPVKKQKLKKAQDEFQTLVDTYFQQLTVGCQQTNCKNKFCASGGIMSLQPQAALVMSIQLASKPNNSKRICYVQKQKPEPCVYEPSSSTNSFLQSLFSTRSFSRIKQQQQQSTPIVTTPKKNKVQLPAEQDCCTDFWKLLKYFNHTQQHQQQHQQQQQLQSDDEDDEEEDEDEDEDEYNDGYLEIDRELSLEEQQSYIPFSIHLDIAIEFLHRALVTQVIQNEKIDLWCRSVFQSWEGIGNSFLNNNNSVQLDELKRFYQLIIHNQKQHPIQIHIMTSISDSFEILLDRMLSNADAITSTTTHIQQEWCRSLICIIQWILCCKSKKQKEEQDGLAALVITKFEDLNHPYKRVTSIASTSQAILSQKLIQVTSKIALQAKDSSMRQLFQRTLTSLDPLFFEMIVVYIQEYLLDHFHTGSYKLGFEDIVIMTLKTLELIYQSNMKDPNHPVIPPTVFYSAEICKKLNIKTEYRVWKRVLKHGEGRHLMKDITEYQRKSRLFMTTSSSVLSYPFIMVNDFQFSWFNFPFLLPPELKRKIVLMDAMSQMSLEYEDACVNHTLVVHAQKLLSEAPKMLKTLETNLRSATCPYLLLEIRRDHFVQDTMVQISKKWSDLKKPMKVKFVEGGEDGVDQGGVQKEFFGVLFEKLALPETGLFLQDEQTRLAWIRPTTLVDVRTFEMVGVLMGLSIYNGVIMNLQFPKVLWKVLVLPNEAVIDAMAEKKELFTLADLEEGWPTLANGLQQLLDYKGDDVEDVFCRDYEISMDIFGQGVVTEPLVEPVVPVTHENRELYVQDYCTYFMYTATKAQILAIRRGIWSVIGSRALQLCTADELEMVACGLRQGPNAIQLDMTELEHVAEYDDGYNPDHPTIRQFWSVVHQDLTNEQKKQLLLFVTASDRIPVGGLKELVFFIQRNGPDSDRLPTALTCFSRLLLPEYSTRQKLRDRLITAIENTKGFGLV